MDKIKVKDLTLADLTALYNNYILCRKYGARFQILTETNFLIVESEIAKRASRIEFKPQ